MDERLWYVDIQCEMAEGDASGLTVEAVVGNPPKVAYASNLGPLSALEPPVPLFVNLRFSPRAGVGDKDRFVLYSSFESQQLRCEGVEILAHSMTGNAPHPDPRSDIAFLHEGTWMTWPGWYLQFLSLAPGVVRLDDNVRWCLDSHRVMRDEPFSVHLELIPA